MSKRPASEMNGAEVSNGPRPRLDGSRIEEASHLPSAL